MKKYGEGKVLTESEEKTAKVAKDWTDEDDAAA